ncbi:MAG: hypothetical protein IJ593_05695 [Lachnospiraceae bacterium]|nr:hypothetical protein [Lachnospiraceae bacterium]
MDINTVNVYLLGIILAAGIMRIVWLLLMLVFSDAPHQLHQLKMKIRNIVIAMAVATALSGLVALIRGYF